MYFVYDHNGYLCAAYNGRWYKASMTDVSGWFTMMTYDPAPAEVAAVLQAAWIDAWATTDRANVLAIHQGQET